MKTQSEAKLPEVKPVAAVTGLVLLVTAVVAMLTYAQARTAITATVAQTASGAQMVMTNLLGQVNDWAIKLFAVMGAGGACVALILTFGLSWWRKVFIRRVSRSREVWEAGERKLAEVTELSARQTIEIKRLEQELARATTQIDQRVAERTASLSKTCAALQEELNGRKQAERAMAQQTTELVRSKDVLELHVQARTQELQKLQRLYESILNSAGEGIYGLDLQGRMSFVNLAAARLTGFGVEEMVGKSEQEVFSKPGEAALPADVAGDHLSEQTFLKKDGTSFLVEYVRTPIKERDKLSGAVVIFKDITERKRAEEALNRKAAELARSNAELEQFAYVASHDLQEPLRKIQAFGDRLKGKFEAAKLEDGRDYLERMQSAAARMQTLINDLLTFSRVISNTQPFSAVDLGVVTKEVLGDLEVRIERTKAQVEVGSLPTIEADPMQMRQLLQNLIGNALKFQAPGNSPVVKIQAQILKNPLGGGSSHLPEELCELTIQDNGIGFEDKYVDKIFAVFQRLHGRNEFEGTGVGLAVCRRITDRHGGSIQAKGELGKGATFTVTLPVRQPRKESSSE